MTVAVVWAGPRQCDCPAPSWREGSLSSPFGGGADGEGVEGASLGPLPTCDPHPLFPANAGTQAFFVCWARILLPPLLMGRVETGPSGSSGKVSHHRGGGGYEYRGDERNSEIPSASLRLCGSIRRRRNPPPQIPDPLPTGRVSLRLRLSLESARGARQGDGWTPWTIRRFHKACTA